MKINEVMTSDVKVASPNDTLANAAKMMAELDCGCLPVSNGERLVGMITDRDIAIRAVAEGLGPETPVADIMTGDVKYCFDTDMCADVARNMGEIQLRRLPVVDKDKRLVGIVSLGDLAVTMDPDGEVVGDSLAGISRSNGLGVPAL